MLANAVGGIIGGSVVDSHLGSAAVPFAAAVIPAVGALPLTPQERATCDCRTNTWEETTIALFQVLGTLQA